MRVVVKDVETLSIGVVGGGLVGALAALSIVHAARDLDNIAIKVDLYERYGQPDTSSKTNEYQSQFDARNIVLSSATAVFLKQIGLWDAVVEQLVPIEELKVSRLNGFGKSTISAAHEGVNALGYVADMGFLAAHFLKAAQEHQSIQIYFSTEISRLQALQDGYLLQATNDNQAQEKKHHLIVAADGQNSSVCQHLGIRSETKTYSQHALVANVQMDKPIENTAYEQFIQGGAITLLPLNQVEFPERMSLVWIDEPGRLRALTDLSEQAFLQELSTKISIPKMSFASKGHAAIYPLSYQLRTERARPHLVVVGNAAQTLHPIAAQGFNLAVRDIRDFIQLVFKPNQPERFSGRVMQEFTDLRLHDIRRVKGFVNILNTAFFKSSASPIRGFLQDSAILGFELLPGAKASLSRFAMGGRSR